MIRVVQWATGSMGRTALRRVIDHPDLELVGVYVYGADKVGRDAGQIARRPATGVLATGDIEAILALDADLVLHMPRITLPYDALAGDVARLLQSGKDVVSIAGFHWPGAQGAAYADFLLAACRAGGSTLAGVGVNPGTVVERIALAATVLCADLERLEIRETVDASAMTSAAFVFELMGLGADPAQRDIRSGPLAELYSALFGEVLAFAAFELGSEIARIVPDHRLTLAPRRIQTGAGPIEAGCVAATEWRWTAELANGREVLLSVLWTADPRLHGDGVSGHWLITVTGRPNLRLTLDISESDAKAPPSRALADATVAVAVRAIPDVIAAPPGFFAYRPPATWRERLL